MIFDSPDNLTRVTQVLTTADSFTGGYLGLLIWLTIGFGTFVVTGFYSSRESFVATSFVMLITGLMLKYFLGILGDFYIWISVVLFIVSLFLAWISKPSIGGA